MPEKLGFNETLVMALMGFIALFALGAIVGNIGGFSGMDADAKSNLNSVSKMLSNIGLIGAGAVFVMAAIRAEGHATGIRAAMLIIGLLMVFQNVFGFNVGFSLAGTN